MKNYPHCIEIKGYKNTLLYDLDFNKFTSLIYGLNQNHLINENWDDKIAINHELMSSKMLTNWDSPSIITNAIIDISVSNELYDKDNFKKILRALESLNCKHIVLNIYKKFSIYDLSVFFNILDEYSIHSVRLQLNYSKDYFSDEFGDIVYKSKTIVMAVIFSSPFDKNYEDLMHFTRKENRYITTKSIDEFSPNISLFSESQLHNTYFNRKLYISNSGEIKNAPECKDSFGTIENLKMIKRIVEKPTFQKYWFVHKGLIDVCKDCEFKHMCVDNRLPSQRKDKSWYFKEECNYNPYIGKWKNEDGYLSLKECGVEISYKGYFREDTRIVHLNSNVKGGNN